MPNAVTDTHALIWYLQDDARLSPVAAQYFDSCEHDGGRIRVPSICNVGNHSIKNVFEKELQCE
jgi:hypothetical protein